MALASDLAAFYAEHRRCGELDNSSLENGDRVTVTCTCGAVFNRLVWESDRSGQPSAHFNLGFMYDKGAGVPQDYAEAAKWYRHAAEQGSSGAQFNLGLMYDSGRGVAQDYAEAVKWFHRAAEQGHAAAGEAEARTQSKSATPGLKAAAIQNRRRDWEVLGDG